MQQPIHTGYAPVNGLKMYYEIYGNGEIPLLLIHGGGSTIESSFGQLIPILAAERRVIAVELQAHGRTADREAPESFTQDADDVAALIRYLKIGKADVLGFSNGGSTALQMAIRHAGTVRKVVAISAAYKRDGMVPGLFDGLQHATLEDMPAPLKEAFLFVTPDERKLRNMFEKDRQRMLNFTDWPDDELRSVTAPTLLVAGDHDVVTISHTEKMMHLIPSARLAILPGIHGECIGEVCTAGKGTNLPKLTAQLISEFLNN